MAADTAVQAPEETTPQPDRWPPTRHLTVDEAMVAVMREIGGVGKNGFNSKHNYSFRAQEDIVAAVRGPMARYGLRMLPRVLKAEHFPRGKSNVAILTIEYVVRGPAGDVMEPSIVVVGEGADVSDKASNKAMTAAKKYALVQAFEIASEGVDEGDRQSPDTENSPLDQYLRQIQRREVWYNREELGQVRQRAIQNGHGDLIMPDGQTLLDTIDAQGGELLRRMEENARRNAEEREARDAQMRAEHPEYHRSSPDEEVWQQPAAGAQARPAEPTNPLPDPAQIEKRLAEAIQDPQDPVKALNATRKEYTVGALKQVRIHTKWGEVDANSAITAALREIAQRRPQPGPVTPSAPVSEERQQTTEAEAAPPEASPAPPEQPHAPKEPEEPEERQEELKEEPERGQASSDAATVVMSPAQPRGTMTDSQWARHRVDREAEFQAYILGVPLLEYVKCLLPDGATSVKAITANLRIQRFVTENRARVIAVLIERGMARQAEAYVALGQRAPAPNIEAIIESVTGDQSSA